MSTGRSEKLWLKRNVKQILPPTVKQVVRHLKKKSN